MKILRKFFRLISYLLIAISLLMLLAITTTKDYGPDGAAYIVVGLPLLLGTFIWLKTRSPKRHTKEHLPLEKPLSKTLASDPPRVAAPEQLSPITTLSKLDSMDGHQFEHWLMERFSAAGWNCINVGYGGSDQGADLVIEKSGKSIVIQAKRYHSQNRVGNEAIQQAYAAIPVYNANEAWVITTGVFTPSAVQLAAHTGVRLFDRAALTRWLREEESFGT